MLAKRDLTIVMSTTIEVLTSEIRAFRDARDWMQFHNPKELVVAIVAEAGELLQHFVWLTAGQSESRVIELARNAERYPISQAKGSNKKYNEL
jgi:hypothetical protein